jgi:hypothetical protein
MILRFAHAAALASILALTALCADAQLIAPYGSAVPMGTAATPSDGSALDDTPGSAGGFVAADKTLSDGLVVTGAGYASWQGSAVTLTLDRIENNSSTRTTGTMRLEVWATTTPPSRGQGFSGYRLNTFAPSFNPLLPRTYYYDIVRSGSMSYPPDGTYWLVIVLAEFNSVSCSAADRYCITDSGVSSSTVTFGQPLPLITPFSGIWWNPNESGTGYSFDVQHGSMVALIFSYQSNGSPEWYYVSGALTNNGRNFSATLDKYRFGQCISCSYGGRPSLTGNDGLITITFFSSTRASISLPGGRTTTIQPMTF